MPELWFGLGVAAGAFAMFALGFICKINLGHHHRWSGWIENLGRHAIGERYRTCDCGAIEIEEKK